MSEVFHKSFYTTRSAGYKYRTLATNTHIRFGGVRLKEDAKQIGIWDRKMSELKKAILSKVENESFKASQNRDFMNEKFKKVDAKVDSMLELQNTVLSLRKDLNTAASTLMELLEKVDRLDTNIAAANSFESRRTNDSFNSNRTMYDELEKELAVTNLK